MLDLNHLPRLVEPGKMDEEAEIFWKKLIEGMRLTIGAEKLSDYQQRQLVLPTREAGAGGTSADQTLYSAYAGAAAAVAQFFL